MADSKQGIDRATSATWQERSPNLCDSAHRCNRAAPGSLNCLEGTIRFSSLSYWGGSRGFQSLVCCLNQQDETRDPHQTPNRHQHLQHVSKVHLSRRARPIASVMALGN